MKDHGIFKIRSALRRSFISFAILENITETSSKVLASLGVALGMLALTCNAKEGSLSASAAAGDLIVEMEPYVVKADRILPKPESWFHIKIPAMKNAGKTGGKEHEITVFGYEILFSGRIKDARDFARELQHRQVLSGDLLLPLLGDVMPDGETIVIRNGRYSYLHKYGHRQRGGIWNIPYRDEDAPDANGSKYAQFKRNHINRRLVYYEDRPIILYGYGQITNSHVNDQIDNSRYLGTAGEASRLWTRLMLSRIDEKKL